MLRLAIYDMDKTITREATWTPFLLHAARARAPWRLALLPLAGLASLGYAVKLIDRAQLKQVTQRLMLGGSIRPEDLQRISESFAERVVSSGTFCGARDRIAADRAEGYRVVMATASYDFYVAQIARRLDIADVIATQSRTGREGRVLARIEGENTYGPAKLAQIVDWFARQEIDRKTAHVRFYSDHVSDAPSLEWADEAFAVNPHLPLRALAKARGWTVIDWED